MHILSPFFGAKLAPTVKKYCVHSVFQVTAYCDPLAPKSNQHLYEFENVCDQIMLNFLHWFLWYSVHKVFGQADSLTAGHTGKQNACDTKGFQRWKHNNSGLFKNGDIVSCVINNIYRANIMSIFCNIRIWRTADKWKIRYCNGRHLEIWWSVTLNICVKSYAKM